MLSLSDNAIRGLRPLSNRSLTPSRVRGRRRMSVHNVHCPDDSGPWLASPEPADLAGAPELGYVPKGGVTHRHRPGGGKPRRGRPRRIQGRDSNGHHLQNRTLREASSSRSGPIATRDVTEHREFDPRSIRECFPQAMFTRVVGRTRTVAVERWRLKRGGVGG